MDYYKPKFCNQFSPRLSNGYVLPEGRVTPNAIFVGGIDMKVLNHPGRGDPRVDFVVDETEMRELFGRYGSVKEVKIITYRGGICKGYGFVYFNDETNIQPIIEITFKGRKLKLGPAIMKERTSRPMSQRLVGAGPGPWVNPIQYFYCSCCTPVVGGMAPPPPTIIDGGSQPYSYPSFGGVAIPQMPMSYGQNTYTYQYAPAHWPAEHRAQPINQNFVDSGVQTMLNVL